MPYHGPRCGVSAAELCREPGQQVADGSDVPFAALPGLDAAGVQLGRERAEGGVALRMDLGDDRGQCAGEVLGIPGARFSQRLTDFSGAAKS